MCPISYTPGALQRDGDAIAVARELLGLLTYADEPEHVRLAARTLGNIAFAQERLGQSAEAIRTHGETVRHFANATDAELHEHARKAREALPRLRPPAQTDGLTTVVGQGCRVHRRRVESQGGATGSTGSEIPVGPSTARC